jgi:hypothetical protein
VERSAESPAAEGAAGARRALNRLEPLGLDALTRAVIALRPENEAAVSLLRTSLGITPPTAEAVNRSVPEERHHDTGERERVKPVEPADVIADPMAAVRVAPPRVTRLFSVPAGHQTQQPSWLSATSPLSLQGGIPDAGAKFEPLIPARTSRGIVKTMLATPQTDGTVDVAALIEALARSKPLARWPRRYVAGLAVGAAVVVDNGPQVAPFRPDIAAVLRSLHQIVGGSRLALHICAGWPPDIANHVRAAARDPDEATVLDEPAWAPPPRVPVLIISDFGLSPVSDGTLRANVDDWCRFAADLRQYGNECIGLLPFPESDWPARLVRSLTLMHWTTDMTARGVRRAREHGVRFAGAARGGGAEQVAQDAGPEVLAKALAPAARIDHALLRAMRRLVLPHSSPALEAALWWGSAVGSRGEAAITLNPQKADAWRAEVREEIQKKRPSKDDPLEKKDSRLALIKDLHAGSSATLQLQEEIVRIDILREPGWEEAIAGHLKALLRAMIDAAPDDKRARDAARWCWAALPELTVPEPAIEVARDLMFAAGQRLGSLPLSVGPLAHAQGPPGWLTGLLQPSTSGAKLAIGVEWDGEGLHVRPSWGESEHSIAVANAPYPALRVQWENPDAEPHWVGLRRGATLRPANADGALLIAQDGACWHIEDADVADSRPPLRVFVLAHPDDRSAGVEQFVRVFEESMRQYAGLPDVAPVSLERLQGASWRTPSTGFGSSLMTGSISTWRASVRHSINDAVAHVLIATKTMLKSDWIMDALGAIEKSRIGQWDEEPVPFLAIDLDGSWSSNPSWPPEASWLKNVQWERAESGQVQSAQRIAKTIVDQWRDRRFARRADMRKRFAERLDPQTSEPVIYALQGLALAFHVRAFEPAVEMDGEKLDRTLWGLDALPQTGRTENLSDNERKWYRDLAGADFSFVRGMNEYVYLGPVREYLNGRDPFGPESTIENYREERDVVLAGDLFPRTSYIRGALQAFARFARPSVRARFAEAFADPELIATVWEEHPRGPEWPRVAALMRDRGEEIFAAIHPTNSWINARRQGSRFSPAACRTFPEFMEAHTGLFTHYIRNAARRRPGTMVRLSYSHWLKYQDQIQKMFPECFDFLNHAPRREKSDDPVMMPITNYADLVANLSDMLTWTIAGTAGERLREAETHRTISAPAVA